MAATAIQDAPKRGRKAKTTNCEECGAVNNRHVSTCSQCENRCAERLDGERCDKFAGHEPPHTSHATTGETLAWGHPGDMHEARTEVTTPVDGVDAKIIIDGETGEVKSAELGEAEVTNRIRVIGRKEMELDRARADKKAAAERVKTLEEEHEMLVRDLVRCVTDGEMMLPFVMPQAGRSRQAMADRHELDDEQEESEPLVAADDPMIRFANVANAGDDMTERAISRDTEMLSEREPGTYVSDEEGPVD